MVVLREEREWERYVIRSITFQDQVSVSYQLNQRRSLKEFRTECIKEHCVSLSIVEEEVEAEAEVEGLGSGRPGKRAVKGGR